jgi:glycerol-3-phosphate O-acyltransferase
MDRDQVRILAGRIGLSVPEGDLEAVAAQLSTFLQRFAAVASLLEDEEPAFLPEGEGIPR